MKQHIIKQQGNYKTTKIIKQKATQAIHIHSSQIHYDVKLECNLYSSRLLHNHHLRISVSPWRMMTTSALQPLPYLTHTNQHLTHTLTCASLSALDA